MKKISLITLSFLSLSLFVVAQATTSAEIFFKNARDAAFEEKNYVKAIQFAHKALLVEPYNTSIEIFLGRVFTWSNQYDSAHYYFTKILLASPINQDASIAYADLEYWNNHYEAALKICNNALASYPASEELLLIKIKILNAEKNFREADVIVKQLLKVNKNNITAVVLASSLKDAMAINKIGIIYDNTYFDKQFDKPWRLRSIFYARQTKLGSITARLNYANRFGKNGLQGETDIYPRFNKTFYSYISFGYSNNVGVFPKYRAGFSLYANLPKSFEAEVGLRYLYFTSPTNVYTLYIGKYYKNFLFSARTYVVPSDGQVSASYSIAGSYYFKNASDYVSLSIGSGISPDDTNQNIQLNTKQKKLSSKQISARFNHTFLKWNIISISSGLINQEYQPNVNGNQFNVSVGLSHRF